MSDLVPTSGAIDGNAHVFPVRVYYEDTDTGVVVYHATYLHFAERARTEMLRLLGWPFQRLKEAGFLWVVRRVTVDYRRSAQIDDALTVTTSLLDVRGPRIDALQVIRRDGEELVRLALQIVLLTLDGRPARLPPPLHELLLPLIAAPESAADPCQSIP